MLLNARAQLYDYFYDGSSAETLMAAVSDGLIHGSAEENLTMGTKTGKSEIHEPAFGLSNVHFSRATLRNHLAGFMTCVLACYYSGSCRRVEVILNAQEAWNMAQKGSSHLPAPSS